MKKIFNVFATISVVTSGVSSVVACGSQDNPIPSGERVRPTNILTPEAATVNQLYKQLNNNKKPYLIEDNNFWGNEANYRQDLLNDLEKVAHIPPKDDYLLSLDDLPLKYYGKATIEVDIGKGTEMQEADVNIDWELTAAQKPIYQFYDEDWPQIASYQEGVSKLIKILYGGWDRTKKSPYWKKGDFLGWWKENVGNNIPWDQKITEYVRNFITNLDSYFPASIKPLLHVDPPAGVKNLAINTIYQIPLSSIYLLSDGIKYPLGYYSYDIRSEALPKPQTWSIYYDTYHNLMQNELKNDFPWKIQKQKINPYTNKASDYWNSRQLAQILCSKYQDFNPNNFSFTGTLNLDGTVSNIEVWYNGVDQGFAVQFIVSPRPPQEIINDIKTDHFSVPANTNPDVNNPQTIATIKTYLAQNNPKLSADDLKYITLYPGSFKEKLSPSIYHQVVVSVTEGSAVAAKTIYVKLAAS